MWWSLGSRTAPRSGPRKPGSRTSCATRICSSTSTRSCGTRPEARHPHSETGPGDEEGRGAMAAMEAAIMQERKEKRGPRDLHVPVLGPEIVELFRAQLGARTSGTLLDGTLGLGGHAQLLLSALPALQLVGIDQDPRALEAARERLALLSARTQLFHARLSEISRVLQQAGSPQLLGMLLDLGVSSMQLDEPARGFSFQHDGPLDMRMDPRRDRTAADIVNHWDAKDLADLFFFDGGEARSRAVAR